MKINKLSLLLAILFCVGLLAPCAHAQEEPAQPTATDEKNNEAPEPPATSNTEAKSKKSGVKVLDFEADVIEGERKAPNLFVQLETESPDLDTLVYRRNNFNDFHERERTRRPVYRKPSP